MPIQEADELGTKILDVGVERQPHTDLSHTSIDPGRYLITWANCGSG